MKLVYREAKTEDALQLSILFQTVYIGIYGKEGVSTEFSNHISRRFHIDNIRKDIESNHAKLLVACLKENPVGVLQLDLEKQCPIDNFTSAEINKLYILPHFHGKGIAQKLMLMGEKYLQSLKERKAWLITWQKNPRAVKFYQKEGFKILGTAPFPMETNTYTNFVMSKELGETND